MSAAKRSRQRSAEQSLTDSRSQPASKRIKSSHVPGRSGLEFLVDENARVGRKIEAKLTNGIPRTLSSRMSQSHVVVAPNDYGKGSEDSDEDVELGQSEEEQKVIDISSGVEDSSEFEEEDGEENGEADDDGDGDGDRRRKKAGFDTGIRSNNQLLTNGYLSKKVGSSEEVQATAGANDAEMGDAGRAPQEQTDLTFGDLLRVRHNEPVDLQKALQNEDTDRQGLTLPSGQPDFLSGHSLGTLLSQALRTNDKDLLETCLASNDPNTIRATIQRQTSKEASRLLEKIAERVHRRPGRTGNLMIWIQWSLVCHGGYIAHQPDLLKKLKSLAQVLRQRANGLHPLLHLKGKLDLLAAQLELRRSMRQDATEMENQDDEEGVLYIDGQDQDWSSDDDEAANGEPSHGLVPGRRLGKMNSSNDEAQEDGDIDATVTNGISHAVQADAEDESSSGEDEEGESPDGLLDLEAQEGSESESEGSSDEELESEASSAEYETDEDASEVEAVKQPKPSTLNRKR